MSRHNPYSTEQMWVHFDWCEAIHVNVMFDRIERVSKNNGIALLHELLSAAYEELKRAVYIYDCESINHADIDLLLATIDRAITVQRCRASPDTNPFKGNVFPKGERTP